MTSLLFSNVYLVTEFGGVPRSLRLVLCQSMCMFSFARFGFGVLFFFFIVFLFPQEYIAKLGNFLRVYVEGFVCVCVCVIVCSMLLK